MVAFTKDGITTTFQIKKDPAQLHLTMINAVSVNNFVSANVLFAKNRLKVSGNANVSGTLFVKTLDVTDGIEASTVLTKSFDGTNAPVNGQVLQLQYRKI